MLAPPTSHIWVVLAARGYAHEEPRRDLQEGLRLTMTMPPDCSTVHMLMMGAMPMVVPWK